MTEQIAEPPGLPESSTQCSAVTGQHSWSSRSLLGSRSFLEAQPLPSDDGGGSSTRFAGVSGGKGVEEDVILGHGRHLRLARGEEEGGAELPDLL